MSSSIRACVVCSVLAFGCHHGSSKAPENANSANNASSPTAQSATPTTDESDNVAATLPSAAPTTSSPGTNVSTTPQASWSEPSAPAAFSPSTANSNAQGAQAATQTPLNDDQIAKITETVDTGEVTMAKLAEKKATDKRVKKYAEHMVAQHTQDKKKVQSLSKRVQITPADSSVASDLEQTASRKCDELEQASKDDFDRQYINAQVEGHQKVYDLLSSQLIPNATNADLKNRLEEAKTMVEKHLNEAKEIQSSMASK